MAEKQTKSKRKKSKKTIIKEKIQQINPELIDILKEERLTSSVDIELCNELDQYFNKVKELINKGKLFGINKIIITDFITRELYNKIKENPERVLHIMIEKDFKYYNELLDKIINYIKKQNMLYEILKIDN